jgi:phenylpyruvate tautomerase PptA (4-oxalocrotonate tautomerase family)
MPMAIIRVVEGVLDEAGKREVVERVTDALLET